MSSSIHTFYDNNLHFILEKEAPFAEINDCQYKWIVTNAYEFDQKHSLPNVAVIAKKVNDKVNIESIHIQFQNEKEQLFIPKKSPDDEFSWAIRIARNSFSFKREIENQAIEGDLLPEIH